MTSFFADHPDYAAKKLCFDATPIKFENKDGGCDNDAHAHAVANGYGGSAAPSQFQADVCYGCISGMSYDKASHVCTPHDPFTGELKTPAEAAAYLASVKAAPQCDPFKGNDKTLNLISLPWIEGRLIEPTERNEIFQVYGDDGAWLDWKEPPDCGAGDQRHCILVPPHVADRMLTQPYPDKWNH